MITKSRSAMLSMVKLHLIPRCQMRMMFSFVDMGDTDSDFNGDDEEGRERVRSGKSVENNIFSTEAFQLS